MPEPPVVHVSYDPNANPPITVDVDPFNVPPGVFELVWMKAGSFTAWRFDDMLTVP